VLYRRHMRADGQRQHTKSTPIAALLLVSLFRFARVMSFSATRCAAFAFGHVVWMDSCLTSDVTMLRRRAFRCADPRPSRLFCMAPPAIVAAEGLCLELAERCVSPYTMLCFE
jgi:hypothetical protein